MSGISHALRAGAELREVATRFQVSEVTVRRVLRTTVDLERQWSKSRLTQISKLARAQWLAALGLAKTTGPKAARMLEPKAYTWLYRNDREWLILENARARHPLPGNHSQVDSGQRDRVLSLECQRAALELSGHSRQRRVTLVELVKKVPELRTKLHRLDSLPLTARVIARLNGAVPAHIPDLADQA